MFLAPSPTGTSPTPTFGGVRQKVAEIGLAYIWKINLCYALCAGTASVVLSTQQPCLARTRPQLLGFLFSLSRQGQLFLLSR